MATRFIPVDRATPSFLPPSLDELLPRNHLARFVVDIVERLDLSGIEASYGGRGSAAYHPSMLVALLIYGYATGTFTSRRLEQATFVEGHDYSPVRAISIPHPGATSIPQPGS
jgi:transposase